MPSTTSSSVSAVLASSTVMTPSLPTFCMAFAIISPMDGIAVGRNRADLGDLLRGGDLLGAGLDVLDGFSHREIDAALQVHRVHAGGHRLGALADDRLGQNGRGGGAVAGDVAGFRGDLADHLGAHVLELVGKLDFLGDRHAVLGDARSAIGLVEDDVAALGTERDLDGIGEDVDAADHLVTRVGGKFYVFGSHDFAISNGLIKWKFGVKAAFAFETAFSITPMMSDSFMIRRS